MRLLICILLLAASPAYCQSTWIQTGIRDTVLDIDSDGSRLWIATENTGIRTFDPATGAITHFDSTNSIIRTADFRVILCAFGKVYAGSYTDGLYMYDAGTWTHFDTANSGLPGNTIRDLVADTADNSLWLATDGGLTQWKNDTWIVYDSLSDGIGGTYINCLYRSTDGILWVGTRFNGLTKWQDGVAENYNYLNSGINDNFIRVITEDASGMLYVANNVGINTYNPETDYWLFVYTLYTAPLSSDRINQMGFDGAQTFWLATHYGVTRADSANVWTQFYDNNSALPHNTTDALYLDPGGRVYVGTYGGLAFYDNPAPLTEPPLTLEVYPNPVSDIVYVRTRQTFGSEATIQVLDMLGRTLIQEKVSPVVYGECLYTLPVSPLPKGSYHIILRNDAQQVIGRFEKL